MPVRFASQPLSIFTTGRALAVALTAVTTACARPAPTPTTFSAAPRSRASVAPSEESARATGARGGAPAPTMSARAMLRAGSRGTYIGDVLKVQRNEVVRWPDHVRAPLRVWIADGSKVRGYEKSFRGVAKSAFTEWCSLGIPMRVTFVSDSARAEVRVMWTERFADDVSGRTTWQYNDAGLIRFGYTTLSTFRPDGSRRTEAQLRAIALHEVGHALGLQHALDDNTSIMAPRVDVLELSEADKATVRLLYQLPPGRVR